MTEFRKRYVLYNCTILRSYTYMPKDIICFVNQLYIYISVAIYSSASEIMASDYVV